MKHLMAVATLMLTLAVKAEVRWIEKDYDFGLMKEVAGPKTGHARFVNLGPDPVTIFSVRPSCGCTSAEFSDEPVAPGDTATISFTYDPTERPGRFEKSVKVRFTDGKQFSIPIRGNVLGTPESVALLFPVDAGDMRLSDSVLDLKEVTFGHTPVRFFSAYSLSLDSITPALDYPKKGLVINCGHHNAGPGDMLTYSVDFDSRSYGAYGPVELPISFTANPSKPDSQPVTVTVRAFVVPDREMLLASQGKKNPRFELDANPLNLGSGIGDGRLAAEVEIRNGGNGPLHILSVSPGSQAVTAGKLPKEIKPGKTAKLKLQIDASRLPDGAFRLPLEFVTDDPDHPRMTLNLTGER